MSTDRSVLMGDTMGWKVRYIHMILKYDFETVNSARMVRFIFEDLKM
jgi:hypothetical protein